MISAERLRELLDYDHGTGLFTWRQDRGGARKGVVAGRMQTRGYIQIGVDRTLYLAHRLAWLYVYGVWPDGQIDHRDGDKLNNRLGNLRVVNNSQNCHNQTMARRDNSIGVRGVRPKGGRYRATLTVDGLVRNLGTYATVEDASRAYQNARRQYV